MQTPKTSACNKAYVEATKRAVKTLRGGQLLTWHRATERDLNSNYNTKDAIIKTHDRENYCNNIVTRRKAKAIEGLLPEADSGSEDTHQRKIS